MMRIKLFLALCFVGAISLFGPSTVLAQNCSGQADSADQSLNGTPKMQAVTRQANCPPNTITYVDAYIEGQYNQCLTGENGGNQACVLQTTGNTSVTVSGIGCGPWTGRSNHIIAPGGTSQVTIQSANRGTSLNAGSCIPDCPALYGVDYYWNGFECTNLPSPIVVPMKRGNGGVKLTSAADGVAFDIDGDGDLDQVAWTEPGSDLAFLARDIDGDGQITSGKELFGNYTLPGVGNGFEALAVLAKQSNGGVTRGSVTSEDPLYAELLLWTDENHNGVSEATELQPASVELSAIGLGYQPSGRKDGHGNAYMYQGWAHSRTKPGHNPSESAADDVLRRRILWDVFLTRQQ